MHPVHSVLAPVRTLLVLSTVAALPAIAQAQTTPSIAVIGTGNMGGALDLLGTPPTVMIAADDRAAKEAVARLVADIGLDPFDAGPLRFARSIESFGHIFWVPLLQGRDEGIEFRLMRSSFWPCFWDVQAEFGTPDDIDDLAEMPRSRTPRPCDSYIGGEPEPDSAGGR